MTNRPTRRLPSAIRAARLSQSTKRSTSRSNACACLAISWPNRDGLGVLQMGEARRSGDPRGACLRHDGLDEIQQVTRAMLTGVVAQVQPEIGGHLIVADCDRRAVCRPARGLACSSKPAFQRGVDVLVVRAAATNSPERTSAAEPSRPAPSRSNSSSVSSPARCSTRACALRLREVVGRQNPVELRRHAQGCHGVGRAQPETPPHNRSRVDRRLSSRPLAPIAARRRWLLGRPNRSMKPLAADWSNVSPRVVGRQAEVVQRLLAATTRRRPRDRHAAHPNVAGDRALVDFVDEGVQRMLQRGEPESVVDQFAPALGHHAGRTGQDRALR